MSQFVTYIRLEPFVKQWLVHSYGEPVRFPPQGVENATIRRFTQKQPSGVSPIDVLGAADGDTPVCIPDSKAKDPAVYNYLGPSGRRAVQECVEDMFKLNLWTELNDLSDVGCTVMTAIYSWCEMHGISLDYADTIRQRYYRLRDGYLKRGVDLRRKRRMKG